MFCLRLSAQVTNQNVAIEEHLQERWSSTEDTDSDVIIPKPNADGVIEIKPLSDSSFEAEPETLLPVTASPAGLGNCSVRPLRFSGAEAEGERSGIGTEAVPDSFAVFSGYRSRSEPGEHVGDKPEVQSEQPEVQREQLEVRDHVDSSEERNSRQTRGPLYAGHHLRDCYVRIKRLRLTPAILKQLLFYEANKLYQGQNQKQKCRPRKAFNISSRHSSSHRPKLYRNSSSEEDEPAMVRKVQPAEKLPDRKVCATTSVPDAHRGYRKRTFGSEFTRDGDPKVPKTKPCVVRLVRLQLSELNQLQAEGYVHVRSRSARQANVGKEKQRYRAVEEDCSDEEDETCDEETDWNTDLGRTSGTDSYSLYDYLLE